MAVASYILPRFKAIDDYGRPMVGAKLYTYQNNTTTPAATYQDAQQSAANTNPIVLDASGEAIVYVLKDQVYTFVLKDQNEVAVWSQDDVTGSASPQDVAEVAADLQEYKDDLAADVGGGLVGFIQTGQGAVARTVLEKERDIVNVRDFGAIGDGTYHPLSERFANLVAAQVKYPFATAITQSIDWAAIQAALNTGRHTMVPEGTFVITDLIYPTAVGQILEGYGPARSSIVNSVNNNPIFCFGNPFDVNGGVEFSGVKSIDLSGNETGSTLWGVYCPAPGSIVVDGCNNDPTNYYFGQNHASWNLPARSCYLRDVRIRNIKGGIALHVSAWVFRAQRVQVFGSLRGVRNMGACNGNTYDSLYVSSIDEYAILHPNGTGGGAKNTHYLDCVVQQSGWDGNGTVSLLFGEGSRITNMYLERNDEKGGNVDIFIGASESNVSVDGVTHKLEFDTGHNQTVVRCGASNAAIRNVDWRNQILYGLDLTTTNLGFAVLYENIRPRNNVAGLATEDVHIANTAIGHISLDIANGAMPIGPHRVTRGDPSTSATDKFEVRQGRSTSAWAQVASLGGIRFISDVSNLISGGNFEWRHNGEDGTGALLLQLQASNGAFTPGTNGLQNLGTASNPWAQVFAATSTISPSSELLKKIRGPLTEAEVRAWERVQPVIFQFLDAIEQKGDDARLHAGYRAQAVEAAFIAEGLDPRRYALFCEDDIVKAVAVRQPVPQQQYQVTSQRTEQIEIVDGAPVLTFVEEQVQVPLYEYLPLHDAAGNPVLDEQGKPRMHQVPVTQVVETEVLVEEPAGTRLGLRYEECLVFEAAYQRWRVGALEARVQALEARP